MIRRLFFRLSALIKQLGPRLARTRRSMASRLVAGLESRQLLTATAHLTIQAGQGVDTTPIELPEGSQGFLGITASPALGTVSLDAYDINRVFYSPGNLDGVDSFALNYLDSVGVTQSLEVTVTITMNSSGSGSGSGIGEDSGFDEYSGSGEGSGFGEGEDSSSGSGSGSGEDSSSGEDMGSGSGEEQANWSLNKIPAAKEGMVYQITGTGEANANATIVVSWRDMGQNHTQTVNFQVTPQGTFSLNLNAPNVSGNVIGLVTLTADGGVVKKTGLSIKND